MFAEKDIHRPISEEVFKKLKNEMELPTPDEPLAVVDGTVPFSEQLKLLESQL